jgi:5-methyltetrahydropteroyltriglutamate--homocysteine methyltransferase
MSIQTTTVGSYPVPDWLSALPSEAAVIDATRVVFDTQRQAGIDLPTDGELYRFDVNHPDTNGMIEYFVHKLGGIDSRVGRKDTAAFRTKHEMAFRSKPAAVVRGPITEGVLNLAEDCARAGKVAGGPFKFTLTSPYMLAQAADLQCDCVQVDEANIPGNPADAPIAAAGINRVLDAVKGRKAVHFCFGNYGGQTIQKGEWSALITFLNSLRADHLVLELAHRPAADLDALKELDPKIGVGLGVVDIKVNHIESADEIARRIEAAENKLGAGRVKFIHPDCGFWMLKRSIADRKIEALAKGRDRFEGR